MRHCLNLFSISTGFVFDSRYYRIKKSIVEDLLPLCKGNHHEERHQNVRISLLTECGYSVGSLTQYLEGGAWEHI